MADRGARAAGGTDAAVGVLLPLAADDAEAQARVGAFLQELRQLGWIIGRNLRVDYRWGGGDADVIRKHAAELAALAPDVILAHGASTVRPLLQTTRTVPIVFPVLADPVGAGFVEAWRGRAETPPVSWFANTAWAGNGWSCSSKSRRT